MKKPVLVIMAAGMGSRYGGLKQIDPVDEDGHIIIDRSKRLCRCAGRLILAGWQLKQKPRSHNANWNAAGNLVV